MEITEIHTDNGELGYIHLKVPHVGSFVTYQGKSYLVGRIIIETQLVDLSDSPEKAKIAAFAEIFPIDEECELLNEMSQMVDISDLVII